MTDRLARLNLLLEIKKESTHQAYVELVKAKDQFNQNKTRHDQLLVYRQEYVKQLEELGQQGSLVAPLRNRINFINHLDTALIQLNTLLSQLAKNRMKADMQFKQAKTSEEGVYKLIERVKRTEAYKLQRIEQKETDEYAQKQRYSKINNDREESLGE